jgi:putative oxidoreductase
VNDTSFGARWSALSPYLLSILRIASAFIFITSGTMKLFAFPPGGPMNGQTVPLMSQMGIGAILEMVGGGLVLIGLFTRPMAFILSGEMAVAYFQFHFPQSFWPAISGGTPAALFCFIWLYISSAGAGPWSLDEALRRGSGAAVRQAPVRPIRPGEAG